MVSAATPFLRRVVRERYSPRSLGRRFRHAAIDVSDALSLMPDQLRRMLRAMGQGRLKVHMDVDQLQAFGEQIARSANRLALGLIISSLIVGSAIVMTVGGGPRWFGLQFFGMAGFAGAIIVGGWLLLSILRSGGGR
jgi:ubiquinone biosynthesis protein